MGAINNYGHEVELLFNTPLWVAASGTRTCWASYDKSDSYIDDTGKTVTGEKDKELLSRIGNKFKHKSVLEHLTYNFKIKGISRACLQELARHRIASLSVKSTRYTLKELKDELDFNVNSPADIQRAFKYIVPTFNTSIDIPNIEMLNIIKKNLKNSISNDLAKYNLIEAYRTELTWTINARSLQNFLKLRTSKAALWEIREVANLIFEAIPDEHKYLFKDYVNNPQGTP